MAGSMVHTVLDPASGRRAGDAGARATAIGLLLSLAVVALLTLTPEGQGWAWGSPAAEARWYLTGLDSTATALQLAGNLALLAVPAALTVLRWPRLAALPVLAALSLAVGAGIELLQWALPLGRVVSPLDAVLNATGAVVSGTLAAHLQRGARPAVSV
ncbi:VanZ family protein [Blastococcus sp. CT_GayMR16]|uniref:VanZ family protein n=1 Tax=Blastococcus sp. CT_GayMR16 TaxID=2559607 RepID=UPI0010730B68|nr:VanZ family protein [Blastococcus sp. CT_GayMR16]TFV83365.1 VanZ family protein [Blastococcus sp. CT_GayMR16]